MSLAIISPISASFSRSIGYAWELFAFRKILTMCARVVFVFQIFHCTMDINYSWNEKMAKLRKMSVAATTAITNQTIREQNYGENPKEFFLKIARRHTVRIALFIHVAFLMQICLYFQLKDGSLRHYWPELISLKSGCLLVQHRCCCSLQWLALVLLW